MFNEGGYFSEVKQKANRAARRAVAFGGAAAAAIASQAANAQVTLPDTGVDLSEFAEVAIESMGAVIAVAIGGWVAIKVVKKGMGWLARAF